MRSFKASTWLITPIILPLAFKLSSASRATSRVLLSSVPKPSSRKRESILVLLLTKSESAKASAKLIKKLSPPDKVLISRAVSPCQVSSTSNSKVSFCWHCSWYRPKRRSNCALARWTKLASVKPWANLLNLAPSAEPIRALRWLRSSKESCANLIFSSKDFCRFLLLLSCSICWLNCPIFCWHCFNTSDKLTKDSDTELSTKSTAPSSLNLSFWVFNSIAIFSLCSIKIFACFLLSSMSLASLAKSSFFSVLSSANKNSFSSVNLLSESNANQSFFALSFFGIRLSNKDFEVVNCPLLSCCADFFSLCCCSAAINSASLNSRWLLIFSLSKTESCISSPVTPSSTK